MTIEGINKTLLAAVISPTDRLDFVAGNFTAIQQRHPGEIELNSADILLLNQAIINTQTVSQAAANLHQLLKNYSSSE